MEPVPVEKKLRPMIAARERGAQYGGLIISTHSVTKSVFLQVLDQGGTSYHHVLAKSVTTRRRRYWRHTRSASGHVVRVSDTHDNGQLENTESGNSGNGKRKRMGQLICVLYHVLTD